MPVRIPKKIKIKYNWIRLAIYLLIIILLAIVLVVPGVLRIMYRADSQVAMGNARSVRMAAQVIATQQYGRNEAFCDVTREGGIADGLYEEILQLSEVPGDFWILQVEEDGYTVCRFVYREGEYTVWYDADAEDRYTVYHEKSMINTGE
ncbi:hypothetical protein [uncultured Eubacterium sp.]|uniref:hypothetical protein n=1 Tax=uncultured Eubacterium sp. TaxID=165185 RepID=UPI0025D9DC2B|nr:hypothetical protein [uncultured Eubacterium sp.]